MSFDSLEWVETGVKKRTVGHYRNWVFRRNHVLHVPVKFRTNERPNVRHLQRDHPKLTTRWNRNYQNGSDPRPKRNQRKSHALETAGGHRWLASLRLPPTSVKIDSRLPRHGSISANTVGNPKSIREWSGHRVWTYDGPAYKIHVFRWALRLSHACFIECGFIEI